jgi:transposase-like protein
MTKKKRTQYSDRRKAQLVSQALKTSAVEVAEKHSISSGTLSRWVRDPRYGGVNRLTQSVDQMPTIPRAQRKRARALVAKEFFCPHCGGPIITKEA